MIAIDPGHKYSLRNIKSDGSTGLQFYKDPSIHADGFEGTSCQEVLRAVIDRVKFLHAEVPWEGNEKIISHARAMIGLFEARALLRSVAKGLCIETIPIDKRGHLLFGDAS